MVGGDSALTFLTDCTDTKRYHILAEIGHAAHTQTDRVASTLLVDHPTEVVSYLSSTWLKRLEWNETTRVRSLHSKLFVSILNF